MTSILVTAFIYLFFASIVVPLSRRFGLGSVLGYLVAGVIIGPLLGLVGQEVHEVQQIAEFGVVMMMFLVGLELEPARLWQMRRKFLGLGSLQIIVSVLLIMLIALWMGLPWQVGLVVGCILSLSSTAIVLQTLGEKNLLNSPGGQTGFAVLLFQDIAAIPMLALLPLLAAPGETVDPEDVNWLTNVGALPSVAIIFGVIIAIIIGGYYLSRPILRYITRARLPEIFTIFALTLVVGIAALMSLIGLSPALGTFLAGVVLANSEYRHSLESTIAPFKGLLLGLFFITVGAGLDLHLLSDYPVLIIGLTIGYMALKWLILTVLGWLFSLRSLNNQLFALGLCQGGEFGFVLLAFSDQYAILPDAIINDVLLIITLSMVVTPLLFIFYDRVLTPRLAKHVKRENDVVDVQNPVIIAGHGRFGQHVNSVLTACGYKTTVIDYDPDTVEGMSEYGVKTFFGDASSLDMLESAGLNQAKLLVLAIDNPEQSIQIVKQVREARPDLPIVARSYDRRDTYPLYHFGANDVVRETFAASVHAAKLSLQRLGMDAEMAQNVCDLYIQRDQHNLYKMSQIYDPSTPFLKNNALVALSQALDTKTEKMIQQLLRGEKPEK